MMNNSSRQYYYDILLQDICRAAGERIAVVYFVYIKTLIGFLALSDARCYCHGIFVASSSIARYELYQMQSCFDFLI